MKWSWKIAEIAGIGVFMHATFLLLIGWVALSTWLETRSLAGTLAGVGFILALFACVVLHEFGHALTARRYGIKTRDITLLPIGGVARLERMPEDPRQELWVALSGPAVNGVIAAGLFLWLQLTSALEPIMQLTITSGSFLGRVMLVNVSLAAFNLVPAFPMDGGRVVRALLAMRTDYTRATQIAAALGQGMALLFGFLGMFTNPFLLFIALFVWIGAGQEASTVQMRTALGGIPASRAMVTDFRSLAPGDRLQQAVDLILAGSQKDFPVLEGERLVGVLTRDGLLEALARRGRDVPVAEVMRRDFTVAEPGQMLEIALANLQACQCRTLPVLQQGRLVGMITTDNVGEFLMMQAALGRQGRSPLERGRAISSIG